MEYPDDVIAVGTKGKREARVLRSMGSDFVVYGYVDIESGKELGKYSVLLRRESGEVEHLFIVPAGGRELVVKHEIEKKPEKRGIFDSKAGKVVYF
ncbi:hypothetical protein H0O00_04465 [Candidatus Micrarchaeota archaeon]|nr:hypothetical protein [Candidatus Micrarchaeota archaeon]